MNLETLLAGVIGALVAYSLTTLRDWLVESRRRSKELEGLLRLVYVEIMLHKSLGLEEHLPRDPDDYVTDSELVKAPGRPLRQDVWEQVRPRLSQLLPAGRFASLVEYYSTIQWFNELLEEHTPPRDRILLPSVAGGLAGDGPKVRDWIEAEYTGSLSPKG
jgi:hypothetical protein